MLLLGNPGEPGVLLLGRLRPDFVVEAFVGGRLPPRKGVNCLDCVPDPRSSSSREGLFFFGVLSEVTSAAEIRRELTAGNLCQGIPCLTEVLSQAVPASSH